MGTPNIDLVLATADHLRAATRSPTELAEILGFSVPDAWPEFPEAITYTLSQLDEQPAPSMWTMHFFVDADIGQMVGSGGYASAPIDRVIEIGYEVAPAHRRRGVATAAAARLVQQAFDSGEVDAVTAHTLAGDNPSTGVLQHLGFVKVAELADPDVGMTWEWRLRRR